MLNGVRTAIGYYVNYAASWTITAPFGNLDGWQLRLGLALFTDWGSKLGFVAGIVGKKRHVERDVTSW